ncbi:MAG: hypothetical protein JKY34_12750 [Kordiimonadaceae bacterium]|nr:hypothetical protein [Kordiimonadaceae bacterium]
MKSIKTLFAVSLFALGHAFSVNAQSVLKGHDTYQPIDINAERLEMKQKQGRAIFKGAVKVKQGKMTLSAETLTVFYDIEGDGKKPSISRLDAQGQVSIVSETESLSGDWGVYDVERRLITIGGNVTFQQGDSKLQGRRLEFDLISGVAKLDGEEGTTNDRVKGSFAVPEQQ